LCARVSRTQVLAAFLAVSVGLVAPVSQVTRAAAATDVPVGFQNNEPHAAVVNPLNPQNVVVSDVNNLAISTDFGRTFPTTVAVAAAPPTPGPNQAWRNSGDDVIAFDQQGRLFWTYLRALFDTSVTPNNRIDISIFVQQVNPVTGALVGAEVDVTPGLHSDDKPWLAADANADSPFAGNLYLHWTRFDNTPTEEFFSRSINSGATFSAPRAVATGAGEGFRHQAHVAVAPNGDVYLAYHTDTCGAATAGRIRVIRDSTGGANLANGTITQANYAFGAGAAAVTCNRQPQAGAIPNADFLMQGSAVGYVVPDPVRPGNIYVITNDDPNNAYANGDDGDVVLARSTDNGQTWAAPVKVDHGPTGTLQAFPTGAMDQDGNLVITWYDTRRGQTNANGNFLLDTFATFSRDGALTFRNDVRVNDIGFDTDVGAPNFGNPPDNPPTRRIGEYNGLAATDGIAYAAFTGNTFNGATATGQQILFDVFSITGAFPDRFEPNDARAAGVATDLGAHASYSEPGLTIHRNADEDFFKVTALATGRLDVTIGANARVSDLDVQVQDRNGNVVATSTAGLDANPTESLTFPAVAGESYFVRVYADPGAPAAVTQFPSLNVYNLNLANVAAPVPSGVALAPGSDTGSSSTDNVTANATPTLLVRLDTTNLAGVAFSAGTNPATDPPGYKVAVYGNGTLLGYALPVGGDIFSVTPAVALSNGLNFITARAVIIDPRSPTPHAVGLGPESGALAVRIITGSPGTLGPPDLLSSADTGGVDDDNVTTLTRPTFVGTAAPNAIVRLYANGLLVGEGTASSGTGAYQITTGSLGDGVYQITATQEDLAGNVSSPSSALKVTIANQSLTLPGATAVQNVGPVTVDLGAGTVNGYAGVPGASGKIGIVGIPFVNLDTGNGPLDILGTPGDDQIAYRPTGAAAGNLNRVGVGQLIAFTAVSQLSLDALAGSDLATIAGTNNPETITALVDTTAVSQVATLLALRSVTGSLERLGIQALAGNDVIAVTTKDTVNAWVTADAGDPGANTPNGDVLRIIDGSGRGQLQNGPGGAITGSGSFIMNYAKTTGRQTRIDYSGVEKIVKR